MRRNSFLRHDQSVEFNRDWRCRLEPQATGLAASRLMAVLLELFQGER
jgi:hypothetical protein